MAMSLDEAVAAIIASGQRLNARGLAPATSGNYSVRPGDDRIAVTVSGRHKGRLSREDVMLVDMGTSTPLRDRSWNRARMRESPQHWRWRPSRSCFSATTLARLAPPRRQDCGRSCWRATGLTPTRLNFRAPAILTTSL